MNSFRTKHLLIILLISIPIFFSCSSKNKSETEIEVIKPPQPNIYGFFTDTLRVFEGVVKKNETLADILLPHNISYKTITEIVTLSEEKFNVRKIKSGKNYKIYSQIDSLETVHYFVYESNPIEFALINFTDSIITVETGKKEIEYRLREASGVIENSLYLTLKNQNISDLLALKMAEVYAWQIDFYRVQDGDNFKVIFEEKFIDGEFIGIGDIKSAYFQHRKGDFYAFYYEQNGNGEYFDEEGNSLRKAFLISPLKFGRMTSRYSKKRFHPVLHRFKSHLGTDYAAPSGTPIHSTGDGIVIEAKYRRNNGNYVKIRHNGTFMTQYLHMSKIAKGIRSGVAVKQNQVIGYVGMTGLATGPHVCYRFWKNGKQINHRAEKVKSTNPIAKEDISSYMIYVDSVKSSLDSMVFAHRVDSVIIVN